MDLHVQSFLTIMDTMHDFTYDRFTKLSKEEARKLQDIIFRSLNPVFFNKLKKEFEYIELSSNKDLYKNFMNIYEKIYTKFNGSIGYINNIEDKVFDIIQSILSKTITIDTIPINKQSLTNLTLFNNVKNFLNKIDKIIYILDSNSFDDDLFCIDRNIIMPKNIQINQNKLYNTVFEGLFHNYEKMTAPHPSLPIGGLDNWFKSLSFANHQKDDCVQLGDYYSYSITKENEELLFIDEIGVKSKDLSFYLFLSIKDNESKIDFKKIKDTKGFNSSSFFLFFTIFYNKSINIE
jgi:hypothetical protein